MYAWACLLLLGLRNVPFCFTGWRPCRHTNAQASPSILAYCVSPMDWSMVSIGCATWWPNSPAVLVQS